MLTNIHQEDVGNSDGEEKEAVSNQADEDEPMPDDPILDFELADQMLHPLGFLALGVYYVVMALSARFSATVQGSTFVLQSVGALLQFCISVKSLTAPTSSSSVLSNFSPASTVRTAMNQLQMQVDCILQPICPNHKCFTVWYGIQCIESN
ncbi:MAG: hypothetical protein TREMPRED_001877 [Tremellales sp. Tagirdzhanova-0007]|nr:MAG: hypothetical protein TREMPRED_001877 [Tremellales sp. Tagirdzhanova-0007]